MRCKPGCCYISGGVIIVLSALFAGLFGVIFTAVLENLLVIDPDNAIFDSFVEPPVPVYMQFYFFNLNNPDDVLYYGAKPNLTEVGPFTYEELMKKTDIETDVPGAEGTIEYRQRTRYFFVPEMSVEGGEDYNITTINIVPTLAAAMFYKNKIFSRLIWPEIEATMDLFETHTVGELLFEGWELPYFDITFSDNVPIAGGLNLTGTLYDISCQLGNCVPLLEGNKIGLYFGSNNTDDGLFRVNTGSDDMDTYLYIQEWKENSTTGFWNETACNMINGTDGTQFPPDIDLESRTYIFESSICRSLYFTYEKDIKIEDELDACRFVVPPEVLEDPKISVVNRCFCVKVYEEDEECLGSGMLNLANCTGGIPIVLSLPHFYQSSGEQFKFVGLDPQKEAHQTFLDIEPTTGVVVAGSKKIQINVPLRNYGNLPMFQSVPEVIYPIFWGDENAAVSKSDAEDFDKVLHVFFLITYIVCGLLILLGFGLIFVGYRTQKKMDSKKEAMTNLIPMKY